ncbi:GNAT family N-acetyltransferase [Pediococcus cellicola]|uniref:Acetyltransferase n=1 Tax=Pediococcus cellicola TaxID=319652 RepID=A0A0R2IWQ3_9LACO|nr:GNAT family N-acetyltransferase [Pediococcus cellicola]KRN66164.1 acetyltransferase [Pediococcus cellicola]GEL15274.1 N-acetyltransferase [Pediococcus cellicola]
MLNSSKIIVLPATPADHDQLAQIYLNARLATFPWVKHPRLTDFSRDSKGEYLLKAELNHQIVGFLSFYREENFIHLLFVDPEHMHLGVGKHLIEAVRLLATEPVTLKCVRKNSNALTFYKALGFKIVDHSLWQTPPSYTLQDTKKEAYPLLKK